VRALEDPARARARVLDGLDRARAYSWEASARELLAVARGVHERRSCRAG
jgi:hypothetical protein